MLDKWFDQSSTYTFTASLNAGNHALKVEYYEHVNAAKAQLSWVLTQVAQAPAFTFTKNLAKGSRRSPDVSFLQAYLFQADLLSVAPTGFFGDLTELAVKLFQKSFHLPQTGLVGALTRGVLNGLAGR